MTKCIVHGCDNPVKPLKGSGMPHVCCQRHHIARKSGRVGGNYKRDIHNFHRKGQCEACGLTAGYFGRVIMEGMGIKHPRVRDIIKVGMGVLQGDHRDGRRGAHAHYAENVQTLCPNCHRMKSLIHRDLVPVKHRKKQ